MSNFLLDINQIRSQARQTMNKGALTESNQVDRNEILALLDSALATEWICTMRYFQHSVTATGLNADSVAPHFARHSNEELNHAQMLAKRIHQLGGVPSLDPDSLIQRSHSQYKECASLNEMIIENLVAERIAVISYTEMIRYIGESDPTSRRMLEQILEVEEEHADELAGLLDAGAGLN